MSPSSSASVVLLLSGSLRAGSSNEAVLRAAQEAAPEGARTVRYAGLGELPHFNPDDDDPDGTGQLPFSVVELSAVIAGAEALLICTPEYAGTLPGSFKNLLD
ncbi:NADPH-dependent FMN reductase [Streptomyces sp. NPDC058240]|uniref:NADPH-dependent FMN reductase n=1 Tax=Streptomyces sp. NPDC058240 TaxID=3346396 RepID=UPI0036F005A1